MTNVKQLSFFYYKASFRHHFQYFNKKTLNQTERS